MLLYIYETVYKIRSALMTLKSSSRMTQVEASTKQVPLQYNQIYVILISFNKFVNTLSKMYVFVNTAA